MDNLLSPEPHTENCPSILPLIYKILVSPCSSEPPLTITDVSSPSFKQPWFPKLRNIAMLGMRIWQSSRITLLSEKVKVSHIERKHSCMLRMLTYKATTNSQKKIMPALLLHLKTAKATVYENSAKKRQQLCGKKTNKTYSGWDTPESTEPNEDASKYLIKGGTPKYLLDARYNF